MSGRGQYRRAYVGASPHARALVHTLEMKQRYDNARADAVSALLTDLSKAGIVSSVGNNQWDVALKDGAWVRLVWYPDWAALEATASDRELHRVGDPTPIHRTYAAILDRITAGLRAHGVTAVSGAWVRSSPEASAPAYGQHGLYIGQGSIIPHTPGEVEDELDQLHSEIMQFGQEVIELVQKPAEAQAQTDPELQRLRAEELAAIDQLNALPEGSLPTDPTAWISDPQGSMQAKQAYDARVAAVNKARALSDARAAYEKTVISKPSTTITWKQSIWDPFSSDWIKWRGEKKDIPLQLWPGSGVWDRLQDYRAKFIAIRAQAPFETRTPEPLSPEGRKDPSLTGGLQDIWKGLGSALGGLGSVLKWGAIGALGLGGIYAAKSLVSKKGKR